MLKSKGIEYRNAAEWDDYRKEIEWKNGVKYIYEIDPKPESNYLRYSIKYSKDVFAKYECDSCGATFSKTFDHDCVPQSIPHLPICSSGSILYYLLRLLYKKSQGRGKLKEVRVFKHYNRKGPGI